LACFTTWASRTVGGRAKRGRPGLCVWTGDPEHAADRRHITRQPIHVDQHGQAAGTRPHPLQQRPDQSVIPLGPWAPPSHSRLGTAIAIACQMRPWRSLTPNSSA
jgi:hypothetical protein